MADKVPPTVLPVKEISDPSKSPIGCPNVAVKCIGDDDVGSGWPAAWLIDTVGPNGSILNLTLEGHIEAELLISAEGIDSTTVPSPVIPLTATSYTVGPPDTAASNVPGAVLPAKDKSVLVKTEGG
jgi:hypothetical protein